MCGWLGNPGCFSHYYQHRVSQSDIVLLGGGSKRRTQVERCELGISAWMHPSCFPGSWREVVKLLVMLSGMVGLCSLRQTYLWGWGGGGLRWFWDKMAEFSPVRAFPSLVPMKQPRNGVLVLWAPWTLTEHWASLLRVQLDTGGVFPLFSFVFPEPRISSNNSSDKRM